MAKESHPSFGVISIFRTTGGHTPMFMSPLLHDNRIKLVVKEAEKDRNESTHVTCAVPRDIIVELEMTEAQFAAMLTSTGSWSGIPCTIRMRGDEVMPRCPPDTTMTDFREETKATAQAACQVLRDVSAMLDSLRDKKNIGKKDVVDLQKTLDAAIRRLDGELPHIIRQFYEYMDGVYEDALSAFEGQVKHRIEQLGVSSLTGTVALPEK